MQEWSGQRLGLQYGEVEGFDWSAGNEVNRAETSD